MLITLYANRKYEVLYNDAPCDLNSVAYLDMDKVSNYFIVNKDTGKVEGTTLMAFQAKHMADSLVAISEKGISSVLGESSGEVLGDATSRH